MKTFHQRQSRGEEKDKGECGSLNLILKVHVFDYTKYVEKDMFSCYTLFELLHVFTVGYINYSSQKVGQ